MPELLVRGGRIVDEVGERVADVRISDGMIAEVGEQLDTRAERHGCPRDDAGEGECLEVALRPPGALSQKRA